MSENKERKTSNFDNNIEKFKFLMDRFEETRKKYIKFGCTDTEPDYEYQRALVELFINLDLDYEVKDWHLFKNEVGEWEARRDLTNAIKRFKTLAKKVKIAELKEIQAIVRGMAWRVQMFGGASTPM